MVKNSMDCDYASGPSRAGFDPSMDWRRCLQKDLSTRSEAAQTAPTASVSSDLIGAWLKAPSRYCPLNRPATTLREAGMLEAVDLQHRAALRVVVGIGTHQEQHVKERAARDRTRRVAFTVGPTAAGLAGCWPSAATLRYNSLRAGGEEGVHFAAESAVSAQVVMHQNKNHKLAHLAQGDRCRGASQGRQSTRSHKRSLLFHDGDA